MDDYIPTPRDLAMFYDFRIYHININDEFRNS